METIARPFNRRPTLGLGDWGLSPLLKLGRPEAAATFVGALARGAFAEVNNFPGVDAARARILERARAVLGDDTTDTCVARGAAMSYDDIVEYAYRHLEPLDAPEH